MANENNVFPNSLSGSTELIERREMNDNQRILRLNILQKLLDFLKEPNQKYLLSAALRFVQDTYDENVFCQELLAFSVFL